MPKPHHLHITTTQSGTILPFTHPSSSSFSSSSSFCFSNSLSLSCSSLLTRLSLSHHPTTHITSLAFHPTQTSFLLTSSHGALFTFSLETNTFHFICWVTPTLSDSFTALTSTYIHTKPPIALIGQNQQLALYSIVKQELLHTYRIAPRPPPVISSSSSSSSSSSLHSSPLTVRRHPSEPYLLTLNDNALIVYEIVEDQLKMRKVMENEKGMIRDACFIDFSSYQSNSNSSGSTASVLLTCLQDHILAWSLSTYKQLFSLSLADLNSSSSLSSSSSFSSSPSSSICLSRITSSHDSKSIVAAGKGNHLFVWHRKRGKKKKGFRYELVAEVELECSNSSTEEKKETEKQKMEKVREVNQLQFLHSNPHLLAILCNQQTILFLDLFHYHVLFTITSSLSSPLPTSLVHFDFDFSSSCCAVLTENGTLELYDLEGREREAIERGEARRKVAVKFWDEEEKERCKDLKKVEERRKEEEGEEEQKYDQRESESMSLKSEDLSSSLRIHHHMQSSGAEEGIQPTPESKVRHLLATTHIFPEKYRRTIYRLLFRLPINTTAYQALSSSSSSSSTSSPSILSSFQSALSSSRSFNPLLRTDSHLQQQFFQLMSRLYSWCPVLQQVEWFLEFVLAGMRVYEGDRGGGTREKKHNNLQESRKKEGSEMEIQTLETILMLFTNTCSSWLSSYPRPPLRYLHHLSMLLEYHDHHLFSILSRLSPPPSSSHSHSSSLFRSYLDLDHHLFWPLCKCLLSDFLPLRQWQMLMDHIVAAEGGKIETGNQINQTHRTSNGHSNYGDKKQSTYVGAALFQYIVVSILMEVRQELVKKIKTYKHNSFSQDSFNNSLISSRRLTTHRSGLASYLHKVIRGELCQVRMGQVIARAYSLYKQTPSSLKLESHRLCESLIPRTQKQLDQQLEQRKELLQSSFQASSSSFSSSSSSFQSSSSWTYLPSSPSPYPSFSNYDPSEAALTQIESQLYSLSHRQHQEKKEQHSRLQANVESLTREFREMMKWKEKQLEMEEEKSREIEEERRETERKWRREEIEMEEERKRMIERIEWEMEEIKRMEKRREKKLEQFMQTLEHDQKQQQPPSSSSSSATSLSRLYTLSQQHLARLHSHLTHSITTASLGRQQQLKTTLQRLQERLKSQSTIDWNEKELEGIQKEIEKEKERQERIQEEQLLELRKYEEEKKKIEMELKRRKEEREEEEKRRAEEEAEEEIEETQIRKESKEVEQFERELMRVKEEHKQAVQDAEEERRQYREANRLQGPKSVEREPSHFVTSSSSSSHAAQLFHSSSSSVSPSSLFPVPPSSHAPPSSVSSHSPLRSEEWKERMIAERSKNWKGKEQEWDKLMKEKKEWEEERNRRMKQKEQGQWKRLKERRDRLSFDRNSCSSCFSSSFLSSVVSSPDQEVVRHEEKLQQKLNDFRLKEKKVRKRDKKMQAKIDQWKEKNERTQAETKMMQVWEGERDGVEFSSSSTSFASSFLASMSASANANLRWNDNVRDPAGFDVDVSSISTLSAI